VPTTALAPVRPPSALNLARHLEEAEKGRIEEALALCGGNRTEAARALGISRNALYRKLERMRPGAGTGA
jgi:DNA-binding NtrC family response regulator